MMDSSTSTKTDLYIPVDYTQLTLPFSEGRAFYPAMTMEWLEEDNKTLDPKWPTLTSDMLVPTWTPEMNLSDVIYTGVFDNRGRGPKAAPPTPPSIPNKVDRKSVV